MTIAGLIKKNRIALFLKDSLGVYNRICKSQELSISMNPETEDYDFICKEMPETVLKYYKPSISQNLVMFKGDTIFEELFDMYYNLATDDDAKRDCLIIYMFDGDNETGYKAWEIKGSTIVFDEMACTDNTLNFNINFGGLIDLGTATIVDGHPVFSAGAPVDQISVDVEEILVEQGDSAVVHVSGGVSPFSATVHDVTGVSASVTDRTITITAAADASGTGTLAIQDSGDPQQMFEVALTVTSVVPSMTATPDEITLQASGSDTVTLAGGVSPYTYSTEMTSITVSISDDIATITANYDASTDSGTVTFLDSSDPANTVDVAVSITE